MVRGTQSKIIDFIKKKQATKPRELIKELGISPQALHRHLVRLCRQGVVKKIGTPPSTRYEITPDRLALSARQLKITSEIGAILGSHPAVLLVTAFGSFVRGGARPDSDIDVLVWLSPKEPFNRHDIWDYWDRQSRHLGWASKVSIVTQRLRSKVNIHTLLLDLPEEHVPVFDKKNYFEALRNAVVKWRGRNGSVKVKSFGGRHGWRYSTKATCLDEINFELEVCDVA